ncbi:MAG TPA: hypothetical protein VMJ12_07640 [Candidatus Acidoferrales bacterium]|nr:hypothetical protein [Candidatus Acidoferrales bacterium]
MSPAGCNLGRVVGLAFLGKWSDDHVTKDYGVYGIPSIFLIGPDGKIVAQNLRDTLIKQAVASALDVK